MHRKRFLLSTFFLLLLLVGVPAWLTYRAVRQERLNRALIAAIKHNDTKDVLTLLQEGADPNLCLGTLNLLIALPNCYSVCSQTT